MGTAIVAVLCPTKSTSPSLAFRYRRPLGRGLAGKPFDAARGRVEPVDDRIDPAQPSACLTICIDPPHSFAHGTFHSAPISADAARQSPPLDLPYQGVDASLFLLSPLLLFVTPNRLTSLAPGFLLLLALARPGAVGRLEDAAHDLGDHVLHA